jgi:hypothetical protein
MPDPEFYQQCLYQAFEELQRALPNARAATRGTSGKARAKRPKAAGGKTKTRSRRKP